MTNTAETTGGGRVSPWRIAGWSVAALLLLLPLVAMQFTAEVNWTGSDFIFAAVLIGGVGLTFELAARMSRNPAYRAAVGFALGATFLTFWANGAVGMIGDEGNSLNLMFYGVLALALLGAAVARFRPEGMARAMALAGTAQLLAGAVGLTTDLRGAVFSMAFAGLWLASAACFRKAAQDSRRS